jgi:hypothetical protein
MSNVFSSPRGRTATKPKIPAPGEGTPEELARVVQWGIKHDSYFRISNFRTWQMCELFKDGIQWLEPDDDLGRRLRISGTSPYLRPRQVDEGSWYPMPVQNEIVAPLQNEQARLLGVGSRPFVRPKSSDASIEKAAKLATDVLRDTLDEINWAETEIDWIEDIPTYGIGIIKTEWELDYSDYLEIPVENAVKCGQCGAALANPMVDAASIESLGPEGTNMEAFQVVESDTEDEGSEGEQSFKATSCPQCMGPLSPFTPLPGEDGSFGEDLFGRSLSEPTPRGRVSARVVSPYNFFPQSLGVGVNSNTIHEWYEEHVESLDWIKSHYANGNEVEAESPITLTKWHPVVGGGSQWLGSATSDIEIFDNHARVQEFHKSPWVEVDEDGNKTVNRGRSIVVANNKVLLDGEYMLQSARNPNVFIRRVTYTPCAWESKKNQIWGTGCVQLMIPHQQAINSLLSQVQDARHRHGSPKVLCKDGMDFHYAGQEDAVYSGDVYYYQDAMDGSKPEFFGNTQMQGPHFQELDGYIQAINRITGTMDVEIGQAPKNISSASGVMYIGEKASERRKKRIIRIREAKRKIYTHILQLIHEMYREERFYHVRGRNSKWEIKAFTGNDLMGQDDVRLEDEPYFDMKMFKRESVKDAIQMGTVTADSAISKRKINEELGVPNDINEETNNQVMDAEEEWLAFINEGIEPYVDKRKNDQMIHFKQHLISLDTQEGRDLSAQSQWGMVESQLWGWEDQLDALEQAEQMIKANPPSPEAPEPIKSPEGDVDVAVYKQMIAEWQQRQQMAQRVAQFPKSTELRIMQIWEPVIQQITGNDQEAFQAVGMMARFRAHIEAHYRLAMAQSVAAGQGTPIPAPPGGVETQTGSIPGNPTMAFAGTGSGPGATTASGDGGA